MPKKSCVHRKSGKRQRSRKSRKRQRSRKSKKRRKSQNSNGLMTKVWGPAGWVFLHSCVMGYPVKIDNTSAKDRKRRAKTKEFFYSIGHVFPCIYCRESYQRFIKELPIDNHLGSRRQLAKWLYMIHNKVNKKLGVPPCDIPSFKEVYHRYDAYRAKCKPTSSKERQKKLEKGCVVPKDGRKKRCIIKIVNV